MLNIMNSVRAKLNTVTNRVSANANTGLKCATSTRNNAVKPNKKPAEPVLLSSSIKNLP